MSTYPASLPNQATVAPLSETGADRPIEPLSNLGDQLLNQTVPLPLSGMTPDVLFIQHFRDVGEVGFEEGADDKVIVVGDGESDVMSADGPVEVGVPGPKMVRC